MFLLGFALLLLSLALVGVIISLIAGALWALVGLVREAFPGRDRTVRSQRRPRVATSPATARVVAADEPGCPRGGR
jgi:hypothetical protein